MSHAEHAAPSTPIVARLVGLVAAVFGKVTASPDPAAALRGYVTSLIRTGSPLIAGWGLGHLPLLAHYVTSAQAQTEVSFGLAFAYYAAVRLLETRWPALGRLLGKPAAPVYPGTAAVHLALHLDSTAVAAAIVKAATPPKP